MKKLLLIIFIFILVGCNKKDELRMCNYEVKDKLVQYNGDDITQEYFSSKKYNGYWINKGINTNDFVFVFYIKDNNLGHHTSGLAVVPVTESQYNSHLRLGWCIEELEKGNKQPIF